MTMITNDTAIIVLGQCLNQDGSMPSTLTGRVKVLLDTVVRSHNNNNKNVNSSSATDDNPDHDKPLIILTGGDTTGIGRTEANAMLDEMEKLLETTSHNKIPKTTCHLSDTSPVGAKTTTVSSDTSIKEDYMNDFEVLLEESSKTTVLNAFFCWPLIASRYSCRRYHHQSQNTHNKKSVIKNIMLITSDFHGPRALIIFQSIFFYLSSQQGYPSPISVELLTSDMIGPTTPMPNTYDDGINAQTPLERIHGEIRILQHPSFKDHVRCQIPYLPIPSIPTKVINHSIQQLDHLIHSKYSKAS